jgi:hypothetical protein
MGVANLDFCWGVSVGGGRAIASPRSVDMSKSLSGTMRPVGASAALGASASSLSRRGGGGGSGALRVASVGCASKRKKIVVSPEHTDECLIRYVREARRGYV